MCGFSAWSNCNLLLAHSYCLGILDSTLHCWIYLKVDLFTFIFAQVWIRTIFCRNHGKGRKWAICGVHDSSVGFILSGCPNQSRRLSLRSHGLTHLAVGRFECHITHLGPIGECSVHALRLKGLNILGAPWNLLPRMSMSIRLPTSCAFFGWFGIKF